MACALPTAQMTAPERACCRMMKNDCGQMRMPASHGCCHKDMQSDQTSALHGKVTLVQPLTMIAVAEFSASMASHGQSSSLVAQTDASPPPLLPSTISVLRI
jgi:hypothetical protein